jgi:hypothetical protein
VVGSVTESHDGDAINRASLEQATLATPLTALPIGTPRSFTLLSVPFYLVSEIPRLVGAIRKS